MDRSSPSHPVAGESKPALSRGRLRAYGLAVAAVAFGTALRWSLTPILGDRLPFLVFLVAVLFTSWRGGLGPGLLTTFLGGFIAAYVWLDPPLTLDINSPGALLQLVLYLATGALVSVLSEGRNRVELGLAWTNEQLRKSLAEQQLDEENLRFLAEASEVLSGSLDYETTLASVSRLAVPRIGDWCAVDLLADDGTTRRLAVAHVDPAKVQWALELERRYPPDPNAPAGVPNVLRTGRSELYSHIPDEMLVAGARDEEHLRISRELGLASAMIVPLCTRDRALGAITLVTAESGRHYDETDLRLAEDLGRRAGAAIENARLFRAAEAARETAERAQAELEAEREGAIGRAEELQLLNEELQCQREELETQTEELQESQKEERLQQERLQLLLRVTEAINATFESETAALARLAELAVPALCDWCVIDGLGEDGRLRRLAQCFADPEKERILEQIQRIPGTSTWEAHPLSVLRSGVPELVREIRPEELASFAVSPEHGQLIQRLEARSRLLVPLQARGRPLGVLTLVMAESGRIYGQDELSLAMELASRAAIVADNARLYSELRERDRLKDEFLAMLAHELRNPLAPIRNAVELLRARMPAGSDLERHRETIERQAAHLARMVDDLLDVSRVTQDRIELRREPVRVAALVEEAVQAIRPALETAGQELSVLLPSAPLWIEGDPTRLIQVLGNLLTNASKYTPRGGKIWIAAQQEGEWVAIRVRDTGRGIPRDLLPRIFDLFVQERRSLDRTEGGLGIGLTLVQRLVYLHGGTVEAFSAGRDHGSEFVVRFPALGTGGDPQAGTPREAKGESPEGTGIQVFGYSGIPDASPPEYLNTRIPEYPTPTHHSPLTTHHRILVVEDHRDAAETLAELLQLWGHDVRVCHAGEEALRLAPEFRPDVVFLDIGLPGMDGYEVARRLREGVVSGQWSVVSGEGSGAQHLTPNTQHLTPTLIALTGYGQEGDQERSREAGFDHHVTKPADPETLKRLLDALPTCQATDESKRPGAGPRNAS